MLAGMLRSALPLSFSIALAFPIALFLACSDSAVSPAPSAPLAEGGPVEASDDDATAPPDAAPDATVPSAISSSAKTTSESETHLAVAPDGRVLVAWIGLGTKFGTGYVFSPDRGATFAAPELIAGNLGDPIVASGSDSSFYVGYLDGTCSGGSCTNGHVYIRKAAPGSSTFGAAVDVSEANPAHFYDKPWLMRTGTGDLVTIFAQREGNYPNNLDAIVAARSTDGVAWTRSFVVPVQPLGTLAGIPHACASRGGARVWTVFVDSSSAIGGTLRWSDDGGATWPAANQGRTFSLPSETRRGPVVRLPLRRRRRRRLGDVRPRHRPGHGGRHLTAVRRSSSRTRATQERRSIAAPPSSSPVLSTCDPSWSWRRAARSTS